MRKLLTIFLLLCGAAFAQYGGDKSQTKPASGGGTASLLQHPDNNGSGTGSSATITLTQAIGSGHLIAIYANFANSGFTITGTNNGGTFVHCSNCTTGASANSGYVDAGYILSSSSQSSTIAIDFNTSTTWEAVSIAEYEDTGGLGTFAFDVSGASDSCSSSPCTGVSLSLSGTNDVIYGGCGTDNGVTAISGGAWTLITTGVGIANALNTASGTAPSWTSSGSTNWACNAMAFKVQ